MEDLKEKTVDLANHVEELADTFYRLAVVNVTQRASNIISGVITMVVLCSLGFFVLLFAGMALAWWLGDLVNNRIGGFLLAALFFGLLTALIALLRKNKFMPFVRDIIIRKMYD